MQRWPAGWGQRTGVMGVLNLTPDSFSDGGQFDQPERAIARAERMLAAGADVLDLGAQSTRPGAVEVGSEEELARLLPVLHAIRRSQPEAILSVDTFLAPVAAAALEAGADWINDVSGGARDPAMLPLIAAAGCPYVLMHSRGDSRTMDGLTDYGSLGVVEAVHQALQRATERDLGSRPGFRQNHRSEPGAAARPAPPPRCRHPAAGGSIAQTLHRCGAGGTTGQGSPVGNGCRGGAVRLGGGGDGARP